MKKYISRNIIFPILYKLRFDKAMQLITDNSQIINLMYHGVVKQDSLHFSALNIHEKQFENHLVYLKNNFDILTIEQAFDALQNNKKLKRKAVTITFDDGLLNNYTNALPLLEKYQIPATFFISTILTENLPIQTLWTEIIHTLRYFHSKENIIVKDTVFTNFYDKKIGINLYDFLKGLEFSERQKLIDELVQKYQLDKKIKSFPDEVWMLMNSTQLKKFASSSIVTIGSHAHSHCNLALVSKQTAENELRLSKNILEEITNKTVDTIAYPDGSYDNEIKNIAEKVGYKYQIAVNYRCQDDNIDNRIMKRMGVPSGSTFEATALNINSHFFNNAIKI